MEGGTQEVVNRTPQTYSVYALLQVHGDVEQVDLNKLEESEEVSMEDSNSETGDPDDESATAPHTWPSVNTDNLEQVLGECAAEQTESLVVDVKT